MSICYKQTKINCADDLAEIEKICFPNEFWSSEAIKGSLEADYTICITAYDSDNAVGYINVSAVFDESELIRIAVLPEYRGNKLGETLIKLALNKCMEIHCKRMFLEVRESNFPAINLYIKCGFTKYGSRKNYYKNPSENAVLMSLNI